MIYYCLVCVIRKKARSFIRTESTMKTISQHTVLPLLAVFLLLAGCSGSKDTSAGDNAGGGADTLEEDLAAKIMVSTMEAKSRLLPQRAGERHDPALAGGGPQFTVNRYSDGSIAVFFTISGNGSIRSMTVRLSDSAGSSFATATSTRIASSGTMNADTREASVTTYGNVLITHGERHRVENARITVELTSGEGTASWRLFLPGQDEANNGDDALEPPLRLALEIEPRDIGLTFILRITRTGARPDGEYLPSAERFRIEIRSLSGHVVWNSSANVMFAQVIGVVDPARIGETIEHRAVWDGTTGSQGVDMPPGEYTVTATIPSRPLPYQIQKEFIYGGR